MPMNALSTMIAREHDRSQICVTDYDREKDRNEGRERKRDWDRGYNHNHECNCCCDRSMPTQSLLAC